MSLVVHTLRLVVGLAMLAAAASLILPFAHVAVAVRHGAGGAVAPARAPMLPGLEIGTANGAAGHAIPDARETRPSDVGSQAMPPQWPGADAVGGDLAVQPRFVPAPAPVPPLPLSGIELSPATPSLDGTYRSTVDIPPPPLLDVHSAPPLAAGWTAREVNRPVAPAAPGPPLREQAMKYVVRDGDDLTGIALRTYGHAGAASAIWNANQDRLQDPNVLPIGMVLQLPPAWMLPAAYSPEGVGRSASIEPDLGGARPGGHEAGHRAGDRTHPSGAWLAGAGGMPGASPQPVFPLRPEAATEGAFARNRPPSVRVGQGETLESIAVRFYGDPSQGVRVWQANRDRLRSPELLVPGMELRLP